MGLLALRETRYPITSFFTINEAHVSKDGRWCVSFIDDDTPEPMFNNMPLLENSILLFQILEMVQRRRVFARSVSELIYAHRNRVNARYCITTKWKSAIMFYFKGRSPRIFRQNSLRAIAFCCVCKMFVNFFYFISQIAWNEYKLLHIFRISIKLI